MTSRRLVIRPGSGPLGADTFAWQGRSGESSFHTNLDPELRGFGDVPPVHRDLVTFATGVFLADRTVARPKSWRRAIELEVPVYNVAGWQGLANPFAETLEILSSDSWQLTFTQRPDRQELTVAKHPGVDRVLLFSGGADSLCGAIRSLADGERLLLVSHWDWAGHSAVQQRLAQKLAARFPKQAILRRIHLSRRSTQIGDGAFGDEATRRTRSLLFLSLGLAHASVEPVAPLWVAENGYAALNPPLAGERRGALSTRTTHPLVLSRVRNAIRTLGGQAEFENPFASMTKGEMYADAAATLGKKDAEKILAMSHSCSHIRYAQGTGYPPETQCGVCFGCLVRRAAFHAADMTDTTTYLQKAIPTAQQPHHLRATAVSEVRTVRYASERGIDIADILSVGLPDDVDIDDAVSVAKRGLAELAAIVDVEPDLRDVR
jgi:7-cyano-7-deazaguanine synthase in queuosine biosynthesis